MFLEKIIPNVKYSTNSKKLLGECTKANKTEDTSIPKYLFLNKLYNIFLNIISSTIGITITIDNIIYIGLILFTIVSNCFSFSGLTEK